MASRKEGDNSSIISAAQQHLRQYYEYTDGGMKQTTVFDSNCRYLGATYASNQKHRYRNVVNRWLVDAFSSSSCQDIGASFGISADPAWTSSNSPRRNKKLCFVPNNVHVVLCSVPPSSRLPCFIHWDVCCLDVPGSPLTILFVSCGSLHIE